MIDLKLGDCLELMKEIPNKSIDMILCDLPYGTTACKWDNVLPFDTLWKQYNRIIKDNGAIVLFGSEPFSSNLRLSNLKKYKYDWVWNKKQTGNPFLAKKQPLKIFENIIVFNTNRYFPIMRKGKMRIKGGGCNAKIFSNTDSTINDMYYPTSIIEIANCKNKKEKLHPTQKPVELLEYLIKTYTQEKETVLDNCMGSGSTGVACVNTNRNFIGIELEKCYFEIAKKRIEEAQDKPVTLFDIAN